MNSHNIHRRIWLRAPLVVLTLVLLTALAATARAGEFPNERKGPVLGFNLGTGGGKFEFERLGVKVDKELDGVFGGIGRIGYGVSNSVIISLEGHLFDKSNSEVDVQGVDTLLMLTWYPGGGGFFLRGGLGGGAANVKLLGPPHLIDWEERESEEAGGFGLGYEWRLGRQFALGVALDVQVMRFDDLLLFKDTYLGHGAMSVQLNWYL